MNTIPFKSILKGYACQVRLGLVVISALILAAVTIGCGGVTDNSGAAATTRGDVAVTSTTAGRQPTIDSIEQTVSRIRGLPLAGKIAISYINREQLQKEFDASMKQDYPVAQAQADEQALKSLGLLDKNADLRQELGRMMGEGVIGFYDEQTKELKVVSDTNQINPINEITLSHEVTHALQDQHFDLTRLTKGDGSVNGDRDLAVLSLVEGDATQVENEYTMRVMAPLDMAGAMLGSLSALTGMGRTSAYLMDSLEFPYTSGNDFVSYLNHRDGWEAVNAAYQHPPQSTEQIIHPEKYLAQEAPLPVVIPDLAGVIGSGWKVLNEDVIGEFDLREMLATQLPADQASSAAAGWGGGSFRLYQQGSRSLLVMLTAWDTPGDAGEFAAGLKEELGRRYNVDFNTGNPVAVLTSPDGIWSLAQQGSVVVAVMAPDATLSDGAARTALGL
ncbi:MAG: hypothetical protein ACYCXF_06815 [Thermoleophilia bacterium]